MNCDQDSYGACYRSADALSSNRERSNTSGARYGDETRSADGLCAADRCSRCEREGDRARETVDSIHRDLRGSRGVCSRSDSRGGQREVLDCYQNTDCPSNRAANSLDGYGERSNSSRACDAQEAGGANRLSASRRSSRSDRECYGSCESVDRIDCDL